MTPFDQLPPKLREAIHKGEWAFESFRDAMGSPTSEQRHKEMEKARDALAALLLPLLADQARLD